MENEIPKSGKDVGYYWKRQLFYQKLHTILTSVILMILLIFSIYFIRFAQRANVFMDETKQTLEIAAEFFETANDKLDVLEMKNVNDAIEKTNELMDKVDAVMEKTEKIGSWISKFKK